MRGLLADADCVGQVMLLIDLMQDPSRREFYEFLDLQLFTLNDIGLLLDASDRVIWQRCCEADLVLVTANRNADGPDSLQRVITENMRPDSLPVITMSDSYRVAHERDYAHRTADKLLQYLFEIDLVRGTHRLFIP